MPDKDIISKETFRRLAVDLATYLLELPIDPDSLEVFGTEHPRIEERRADLVVKLRERGEGPFCYISRFKVITTSPCRCG
ncbi:MAG: hypothetical protein BECKG1743D_GA0114223_105363 [Candidatus Kentron sp. G]|nr:MAG: hypothetical protein BECKG1743F_GA0114225_102858 [Candidatus Kentron sp. G]VFN02217.1 MAG: hypothetical protein BECKG1743E_GA0114224_104843 [Candidatus Kentron sp. G]VFN03992.1 MAG: hypothetical protein BECKG1743D_GA0114223_105363 [Candidatus Kentron sp. G]